MAMAAAGLMDSQAAARPASAPLLSAEQIETFRREGFLLIPGFYDLVREIEPIQRALHSIIGLLIERHRLPIERPPFDPARFDAGYGELITHDRRLGGLIYDAAKLIPAFIRLLSCERNEQLFRELRQTDLAGIGAASYGIRIDNPREEQYRSHWHQEYLFQPQSLDGIVFWSPLVEVEPEMGPVQICVGSHHDGLSRYRRGARYADKPGAYQIGLDDEEGTVARYRRVAPLSRPGDLLLMDFLTLHQSGHNVAQRSRWSMQLRYFNFRERHGIDLGWPASVTAGTDIEALFPESFVRA
jgi:hypothetical protein